MWLAVCLPAAVWLSVAPRLARCVEETRGTVLASGKCGLCDAVSRRNGVFSRFPDAVVMLPRQV